MLLFLVTPSLIVAVQPCMEWIPVLKNKEIKTLWTCYLGNFGNSWSSLSKSWYQFLFICMQKTNFFVHFFLKILQRNWKLIIVCILGMPGHRHLKWQYQFEETFDIYLQVFIPGNAHPKWYYHIAENLCVYLKAKKSTSSPMLFWKYC